MKPTNHKAVGVQAVVARSRPSTGGLGDTEASVKKWMMVLGAALVHKNPPAVNFPAQGGQPSARIRHGDRRRRARRGLSARAERATPL